MEFKATSPMPCFCSLGKVIVEKINVISVFDNLVDNAKFKYTLATRDGATAVDGIFELTPETYPDWDATDYGAYVLVCEALGLALSTGNLFKSMPE